MYVDFLFSVMDVLFLCGVVILMNLFINKKYSHYILGVMFGLITIFVMRGHLMVVEGEFFDFRHITMTMAGFIGGPVTAVIAVFISSLYRYNVGGSGTMGGIVNFIIFACFGSILGRYQKRMKPLSWFIIGIVMACILLLIMTIISPWINGTVPVLRTVSGLFLIITPLATTIIFNFYFWAYEFFSKSLILNTIINRSPINLMIFDNQGPILVSKNIRTELKAYPFIENLLPLLYRSNTTEPQHREISTEDQRHFVAELSSFQMPNGKYACVAVINDITDRKIAEETLRQSEEKFSKAFHGGPIMMTLATVEEGRFIDANEALCSGIGYTREEIIGRTTKELNFFVEVGKRHEHGKMLMEQGRLENSELDFRTKSGEIRHGLSWSQLFYLDGQPCHLTGLIDVTEQKRIEKEMAKHTEELSKQAELLNLAHDYIIVRDKNSAITFWNTSAEIGYGWTQQEILGKITHELLNTQFPTSFRDVQNELLSNASWKGELINTKKDGTKISVESRQSVIKGKHGEIVAFLEINRDITERKRMEQEIIRLDQLTLVGEMAAGIGHEVRNPMTTVRGFLQLLSTKEDCSKYNNYYTLMIEELDRANSIITEFLCMAKDKAVELERQSLKKIVENILPLIQSDATVSDKYIHVELEEVQEIPLDKKEIHQLIINLARNGLEAMSPGGTMKLKTFVEQEAIVLSVQDNGKGIPQEVLEKIGTPFFTTKENGTGLGLAVCFSIAARHDAKIDIETDSTGTTFFVRFKK